MELIDHEKKKKQTHITIDVGKRGIEEVLLAYAEMKEWTDCLRSAHVHIPKSMGRHESAFIVPSKLTKVLLALSRMDNLVELRVELNQHVALPVEALLRVLKRRQLRVLTLQGLALVVGDAHDHLVHALETAMADQHELTHVTLQNIRVDNSDGRVLTAPVRALTLKPPHLKAIHVEGTPISPLVTSTRTTMWCYGQSATLTQLHLEDIPELAGRHLVALARQLLSSTRSPLEELHISSKSPRVANSAGAAFAEVLATSPTLTKVALHLHYWDHVGRDVAWALQQRQKHPDQTPLLKFLDVGIYVVQPPGDQEQLHVDLENQEEQEDTSTTAALQEELVMDQVMCLAQGLKHHSRLQSLRLQVAITSTDNMERLGQTLEQLLEEDNETLEKLSLDYGRTDGTPGSYELPLTIKTNLKLNRGAIRQLLRQHDFAAPSKADKDPELNCLAAGTQVSFVDALIREAHRADQEQDINVLFYIVSNHPELCLPYELQVAHRQHKALPSFSQLAFWKKHRHAKPCPKTQQAANRHQARMKAPFRTTKKVRNKVMSLLAPKA